MIIVWWLHLNTHSCVSHGSCIAMYCMSVVPTLSNFLFRSFFVPRRLVWKDHVPFDLFCEKIADSVVHVLIAQLAFTVFSTRGSQDPECRHHISVFKISLHQQKVLGSMASIWESFALASRLKLTAEKEKDHMWRSLAIHITSELHVTSRVLTSFKSHSIFPTKQYSTSLNSHEVWIFHKIDFFLPLAVKYPDTRYAG